MKKMLPVLVLSFCFLFIVPALANDDTTYHNARKHYFDTVHIFKQRLNDDKKEIDDAYTTKQSAEVIQQLKDRRENSDKLLNEVREREKKEFLNKTREIRRRNK